MSIFDVFRRKTKNGSESGEPKIGFGFRGEGISYRLRDMDLEVQFTWINGPKVYTESIAKWENGSPLTEDEKKRVFTDVVHFVKRKDKMPIVVINTDDPVKTLWEQMCSLNQSVIRGIEYTSDEECYQSERSMWLDILRSGKGLVLDGVEITNEKDLDETLQKRRKHRTV